MAEGVTEHVYKPEEGVISKRADTAAKWSGVLLGFSIPVSTALDSVLKVSVLIFWLLGAGYEKKWGLIRSNPVALLCLGMFGLLIVGGFYGDASWGEVVRYLGKYSNLLLVPLLIPIFQDAPMRRNGLRAFFLAMIVTLVLSYLISAGLLPGGGYIKGSESHGIVFRSYITHNVLVAFSAFGFATLARMTESPPWRVLWVALAVIAAYNVLFMVKGRTGYLVLGVLFVYFFVDWLRWRGLVIAIGCASLLVVSAFQFSDVFQTRFTETAADFYMWRSEEVREERGRGLGLRLVWYQSSLAIIRDSPLFGVGTGGFEQALAEKVKHSGVPVTGNPHSEYLFITVQLGLVGLAALLYLFYTQWRLSAYLPGLFEQNLARGLLLTFMTTCLVNSSLLDHGEGLFYAWMSGLLFAGVSRGKQDNREAVKCLVSRS